ncbi:transposase family protein [Micromonospora sp. U56]|nr:transposase family protein [Micromonospora sp. U56]
MAVLYANRRLPERPLVSVSHAVTDVVTNEAGQVDLGRVTALAAVFAQVKDPRKPKGIRHPLAAALTVLTMALLCGARDFRQAADRVAELPQALLDAAGARRHPVLDIRIPPGRDTLRRLTETVDAAVMDRLICTWLNTLLDAHAGIGLALDGKTVRNPRPGTGLDVQLFSAMRHDTAVVIGLTCRLATAHCCAAAPSEPGLGCGGWDGPPQYSLAGDVLQSQRVHLPKRPACFESLKFARCPADTKDRAAGYLDHSGAEGILPACSPSEMVMAV